MRTTRNISHGTESGRRRSRRSCSTALPSSSGPAGKKSSDTWCCLTEAGRALFVVLEPLGQTRAYVVSARDMTDGERRRFKGRRR
jgi:hypothetical protein